MNIVAALQKDSIDITSENVQIGAFIGDECRGGAIASLVPEIGTYRVENLTSGLYIIKLSFSNGVITKRFCEAVED